MKIGLFVHFLYFIPELWSLHCLKKSSQMSAVLLSATLNVDLIGSIKISVFVNSQIKMTSSDI